MTIISFDLETTGFSAKFDNIIELGSVKIDLSGKVIDKYSSFCNPFCQIPKKITEITGIDNSMVKNSPSSLEVVSNWLNWIDNDSILIAHNATFDTSFVNECLKRNNKKLPSLKIIDTLTWARQSFYNHSYKLESLMEMINFEPKKSHRALDDAVCNLKLLEYIIKHHHKPKSESELEKILRKEAKLPEQIIKRS